MDSIRQLGAKSIDEIKTYIKQFLKTHETRIKAFCDGDNSALWDEEAVRALVLGIFNQVRFDGLSFGELRERPELPKQVTDETIKRVLGKLINDGKLEYVDFRCYRVYPTIKDFFWTVEGISDRDKEMIDYRLQGETLESIAKRYDLTRERVRQITSKCIERVKNYYSHVTGLDVFDEDYYRYFFETYEFEKKDAEEWLGLSREIYNYLDLSGAKRGNKPLKDALDDHQNLDYGFRLKIKNYLNRNKLFIEGKWVEKNRAALEEYIIRNYCQDTISFEDFAKLYNDLLQKEEIEYDENIYYTDEVLRTRENRLADARFLLWKQNKQIRYYDIEGRDFSELLDTLNFDSYENIEYSTAKFMLDFPEVMARYDIRDHYELHNLLRKIIPEGSYHSFHCNRTPMIEFGKFDRDSALLELLINTSPISQNDFIELICQEYGYDPNTVRGTYLQELAPYYHQGIYRIDQKPMPQERMRILKEVLSDNFYKIDEIRNIYQTLIPGADTDVINPYNLKTMGFNVQSRYVFKNFGTMEAYLRDLLTKEDITDLAPLRKRFAYIQMFSQTLVDLKNELEVLEFEPNQIICFRKLEAAGVSKDDLIAFCDDIYDFVNEGEYFSIQSVRVSGFTSELFDLGFSDWFYSNLLAADKRFSYTTAFSNIILFSGSKKITIKTFEEELVNRYKSIDVYDLMTEMEETYGCRIPDRIDVIYKVKGSDVYYDKYLDRLYANEELYNRELDEAEGL